MKNRTAIDGPPHTAHPGGGSKTPDASPTRRQLLSGAAALAAGAVVADATQASQPRARGPAWRLGVQSYSFRQFSTFEALERLAQLGLHSMEFYPGHFPADERHDKTVAARAELTQRGVSVPAFGVLPFGSDASKNRATFAFARGFGIEVLTADPDPESFPSLEALSEELGVRIAIHNHGPGHRYATLEDLQRAVSGRVPGIGVCVDTGHALRSGLVPQELIRALGERVHAVHLKDWIVGGEERVLGEGDLDLQQVVAALRETRFDGPVSLEYELQPENPVPAMMRGLQHWRAATG